MLTKLRRFLRLPIGASEAVITGRRQPLGYQQILTAGLGAAVNLTVPAVPANSGLLCGYVMIQNTGTSAARWRDDGVNPTAAIGMLLPAGAELDYTGDPAKIKFIQAAAGAQLEISYYA